MELRSCIHLHFINSLKGGLVIKALNVNRGKPLLKFKTLKDIYETEDEKNQNQDDEFEGFLFDRIKVERPTVSDSEFSCNEDDGGSNSDLDDLGTGKMTQKQIKEKCKAKKRKRSKFADSINDELCSQVKQEADEDEFDPMEPLITWKAKLSKKVKGKTRCLENQVSVPLQSPMSIVKSEQIPSDEDFVGSTESLPLLVNVKVESLETDYSDSQVIIGDSSSLCDDQVDSFRASQSSTEAVEMATDCVLKTQVLCSDRGDSFVDDSSLIHGDKVDSCRVVLNEVSKTDAETEALNSLTEGPQPSVISQEQHEDANSEPFVVVNSQVDSRGTVPREVTEIASELFLGTEKLTSEIEEPHLCAVNEVCYDYVEHDYSEPVQRFSAACADVKKGDIVEAKDGQDLVFPVLEYEGEGCVDKPLCAGIYQEVMLPICDHRSDVSDALPSPANHVLPCDIDSSPKVQSPDDATYGCFQGIESNVGSDTCTLDDGAKDDLPSILETVALYCSDGEFSLASNSCFIPSPEDSPTTEEKQYQSSSTCDGAETNCLPQTLGCDAHDELTTSDGDVNCFSNLDPPPQRLLSTRKAISPDSREKLCMAMESVEIHEEEHYRSQKKLCFGQHNGKETKVNKAERPGPISKIIFSVNQKQNIPKSKHEKRKGKTNVVPKGPPPSHAVPRFTTGCNSIESCSQSAIAFSQRQMQDIECLTTKLTNELKTMKEIAEDTLYSETSTSLKYKANEVRMAIKSARKVEQLANKWLSMMARDCNRFCKIMGLAEKDSDAAETGGIANKERKKITFADEAGEELCHVKFFEKNLTESSPNPDAARPEVLS